MLNTKNVLLLITAPHLFWELFHTMPWPFNLLPSFKSPVETQSYYDSILAPSEALLHQGNEKNFADIMRTYPYSRFLERSYL